MTAAHRLPPAAPAWFRFGARQSPSIGVAIPAGGGVRWFDLGPHDERDLLAVRDPGALELFSKRGREMEPPATLLPPVAQPSKILCLGKNYAAHAAEFGSAVPEQPMFFAKLADTLLGDGQPIVLPHWLESRVDHEVELGVILGFDDADHRGRKYVAAGAALGLVAGFTVLNDVTARKMQGDDRNQKQPWLRSKSFDTFCPLGPWVVPSEGLPRFADLAIELSVNGTRRQQSRTSKMAVGVADAIAFLSRHTTLRPGDVIAMGTPEGVGPIVAGDVVVASIEGIGALRNGVVREDPPPVTG